MAAAQGKQTSGWAFYFVATTLGLAFLTALLVLAWNNVVEREVREFAFESLSLDDTVRTNVRAAHDAIENLDSVLTAVPEISLAQLDRYVQDIFARYRFVASLGIYDFDAQTNTYKSTFVRNQGSVDHLPAQVSAASDSLIAQGFDAALSESAPIPSALVEDGRIGAPYLLLKSAQAATLTAGAPAIITMLINPQEIFASESANPELHVQLYSESEGVGGRQLLYDRDGEFDADRWVIDALEESTTVLFERYSMRLIAGRNTYWRDLEKGLLLTASVLGAGVTLLLVALARAKDVQARELRERNRVIEEQVQRQTHELAQARDQALEASRVKSDFLASMSHEIRTPLNAIIGMAELLSETKLSGDQQKYVGVFKNAGEALLSLVNDILDLSKIEAEQLILETVDFDMRALIEQCAEIYALKTSAKGIELAVRVGADVPTYARGDPARLRQVILNLIGNAIKFTDEGEIVVAVQALSSTDDDMRLEFSVADTGIGIPATKLDAIFGSFSQVDSSTTRKYGGTGLGLTISKKLVEMMDGRIWVESVEGEGSQFKFEIGLKTGQQPVDVTPATDAIPAGLKVLIVDDSETNRLILCETLQTAGARVNECADGRAAVAAFTAATEQGEPFDIVLCDVQMPEMDGFAVIEEITKRGGSAKALLMLTSSNLSDDLAQAKKLGLGAYLVKPIKRAELLRSIAGVLEYAAVADKERAVSDEPTPGTRHTVLLVEDNPDNRLLIMAYLKREPYDVDEAENGQIALEMFKRKSYDLVLMDVQMPVMDGHAATREIRAIEASNGAATVPVIALTAHAIKEDMDKSLAAGCTAHLTKPIKKKTLLAALSEHLAA